MGHCFLVVPPSWEGLLVLLGFPVTPGLCSLRPASPFHGFPSPPQVIQTISALDKDDFANGQRFSFALPSQLPVNPNFTLKDNEGRAEPSRTSAVVLWLSERRRQLVVFRRFRPEPNVLVAPPGNVRVPLHTRQRRGGANKIESVGTAAGIAMATVCGD